MLFIETPVVIYIDMIDNHADLCQSTREAGRLIKVASNINTVNIIHIVISTTQPTGRLRQGCDKVFARS